MRLGLLDVDGKVCVGVVGEDASDIRLIDGGGVARLEDLIGSDDLLQRAEAATPVGAANARMLAPFPRPRRNIICVGKNYRDHADEFARSGYDTSARQGETIPEFPIVFTKATTSVIGPDDPIPDHARLTDSLDYEAELGVIIGRGGRDIAAGDAASHIWGFTIINDVTARDIQRNHKQWFLGKSLDGTCPMGPVVLVGSLQELLTSRIRCWVNGELRQDAAFVDMIFDIPHIIATASRGITLEAGDIIATGTPSGVGLGHVPPAFLKAGDLVEIEVPEIGTLRNRVAPS